MRGRGTQQRIDSVAYFCSTYPRITDGFLQREIAALERAGITVHRFAFRRPPADQIVGDDQRDEMERTTYLLERQVDRLLVPIVAAALRSPRRFAAALTLARHTRRTGFRDGVRQLAYLAEASTLASLMRQRRIDHLHHHFADTSCIVAMLASELSGIPYSYTIHGPSVFFEATTSYLGPKLAAAEFCVAISSFARSQSCFFADPNLWDRIHVVHCGVEIDTLPPAAADPPQPEPIGLLFVGRVERVKGLPYLLDAIAAVRADGDDVRLTIAGDGADRSELEQHASRCGISDIVTFCGYRSRAQVDDLLERCDALVLPSFAEGVPVSLMEAMARERAVIATNVGGVSELVHHGVSGLLVPPSDVDALAEAIHTLASDPDLRHDMGRAGRKIVEADFDSAIEGRRLARLLCEASARRGPIRPAPTAERRRPVSDRSDGDRRLR